MNSITGYYPAPVIEEAFDLFYREMLHHKHFEYDVTDCNISYWMMFLVVGVCGG